MDFLEFKNIILWFRTHVLSILLAFILISMYSKILNKIVGIIDKYFLFNIKDKGIKSFVKSFLKVIIQIIYVYVVLLLLGVNLTALFGIIGAISVVVGFAFKEIIQNIFGGLIILFFKPFKVGDVIEYKNFIGTVSKIEIFYTRVVNFQNEIVIIPNGSIITNELKNITTQNNRRLDLVIGVDYSANIEDVKRILNEILNDCEYIIKDAKHLVGLTEFAASSMNFSVFVYVLPENYMLAKLFILEQIKIRFDNAGINIPFNQIDIHLYKEN
ncbi:mechanosensitive ion channel family protein [Pseudostreptobacillus hongkongensis]|uniref:mechanosensitive ion channel family protein n=1 Tax=Pseudostreptobacillus hongkongensis TaxID=1162717 RepID=UPI00083333E2|nr:mechanosensitive ion channel domain-containing protein [Pseudostreptobacillus hongkongensis]